MPVLLCPGCWVQLLFLGLLWLLLLFFAKVCKFNWAIKTNTWCVTQLKKLHIWKKKEEEKVCPCDKCSCDKVDK